jgi:hypothetical protein
MHLENMYTERTAARREWSFLELYELARVILLFNSGVRKVANHLPSSKILVDFSLYSSGEISDFHAVSCLPHIVTGTFKS